MTYLGLIHKFLGWDAKTRSGVFERAAAILNRLKHCRQCSSNR